MNIGQIKLLSWLAAGLLTAGLAFYVYSFVRGFKDLNRGLDVAKIDAVLLQGEPPQSKSDDLTNYEDIRRLILPSCEKCKSNPNCKHLNWTGNAKPQPVEDTSGPATTVVPKTPVKDLVRILFVKADLSDPKGSAIFLRYKTASGVTAKSPTGSFQFKVGEHLHAPLDHITVEAITAEGVTFAFQDVSRDKEMLGPAEFDAKTVVVQVDESGVMLPKIANPIPRGASPAWNPERTSPIGTNAYKIGTEDAKEFEKDWDRIFAQDLRHERHKDPRTGKYDGIEIKSVTPGSIAERHGAQSGDVVKSINGQPVTSTAEAINFVKLHKDQYTTWEVVIENRGRTRTMVFHSPQR
ncbi:MAG: PDZ domain-containing protein [Planctomycetes bacterium]|nr:PDZ domain-containing protein [Planctomycetota bacterium]